MTIEQHHQLFNNRIIADHRFVRTGVTVMTQYFIAATPISFVLHKVTPKLAVHAVMQVFID